MRTRKYKFDDCEVVIPKGRFLQNRLYFDIGEFSTVTENNWLFIL